MTDDRSLERAARAWIEAGPTQAPDRAVEAALARVETTPQERAFIGPWRLPDMRPVLRLAALGLAVVALGALFVMRGGNNVGGPSTPSPTPVPPPTASPAPPSAAPSQFAGACSLLTSEEAEEAAGVLGLGALPTELGSGNETSCLFSDGGGIVLRVTWTKAGGEAAFAAVRETVGVEAIVGLGDEALYDPATHALHLLSRDAAVTIVASPAGASPASRRSAAEAIGELVAGRM